MSSSALATAQPNRLVNGDGFADLAVTALLASRVYVFLGSATSPATTLAPA
jgi:hypothetical protein